MERRQSRLAESVWRDRLARFRKSKLTVAEFCRQEGVSDPSFYQWRKRLGASQLESEPVRPTGGRTVGKAGFVPVRLPSSGFSEVEFPNGVRIRVPATNAEALRLAISAGNELCREVG